MFPRYLSRIANGLMSSMLHFVHHFYRSSKVFHFLGRLFLDRKIPSDIPKLETIEEVSTRRVFRILGLNPGSHTLQGTNTYLIGSSESKILIDTGEDISSKKYVSFLFDIVFPHTRTTHISKILLTHGHGDHQGGVTAILKECKRRGITPLPTVHKRNIRNGNFPAHGFKCIHISDGDIFKDNSNSTTIRSVYSPGHTDDHVAFIIEEDSALLSGDCVLGCGTTVFDDLYTYMTSLKMLRELIISQNIKHIYPGHGPIIRDTAVRKVEEYIAHRNERERQVLEVLQPNGRCWISTWELVPEVYGCLPFLVKVSAQFNLSHHLDKLNKEGRVEKSFPDMWRMK